MLHPRVAAHMPQPKMKGLPGAVGQGALKSWSDLASPSFCVSRFTDDPENAYSAARTQLESTLAALLFRIDQKIDETQEWLARARAFTRPQNGTL